MKTAISLPDDTYALATRRAAQMGVSRSAFFAAAAVHYLEELDRMSLTHRIDAAVSAIGLDASAQGAVSLGPNHLDEHW